MNTIKFNKLMAKAILIAAVFNQVQAQTTLNEINIVGDIDHSLPASSGNIYSSDDAIIVFDLNTNTATKSNDLGNLDGAGIDGFHKTGDGCGDSIYSLDNTAVIAGTAMRSSDVFTASGVKVLDAENAGIDDGVNINAVSRDPVNCDLILSVDITTTLNSIAFRPDDLIRWNSTDGFSLLQSTGFGININAIHYLNATRWLISTDIATPLPDIDIADEQIIEIGSNFQLLTVDLINFDNSWDSADVNALWAVPKPIVDFMFADGFE